MSAVGAGQQHSTLTTDRQAAHLRGAPAFQVICGCLPWPVAANTHHVRCVPPKTGFGQNRTAMLQTATRTAHCSSTKHRFSSEQVHPCSHKPPCQALNHGGSTHATSHGHPLLGQLVRLLAQALIVLVGNRRHACTIRGGSAANAWKECATGRSALAAGNSIRHGAPAVSWPAGYRSNQEQQARRRPAGTAGAAGAAGTAGTARTRRIVPRVPIDLLDGGIVLEVVAEEGLGMDAVEIELGHGSSPQNATQRSGQTCGPNRPHPVKSPHARRCH